MVRNRLDRCVYETGSGTGGKQSTGESCTGRFAEDRGRLESDHRTDNRDVQTDASEIDVYKRQTLH